MEIGGAGTTTGEDAKQMHRALSCVSKMKVTQEETLAGQWLGLGMSP